MYTGAHGGSDSQMSFHLPNTSVALSVTPRHATSPKGRGCAAHRGSDSRMSSPFPRTTIVFSVMCAEQILKHFYEGCILGDTYFF